ncbi:MAG TPA: amidohydrolase family protein [Bryobacteraceae bacterium]|nr:amidohydrolase family protein [Bryobacteraceae bacterium]
MRSCLIFVPLAAALAQSPPPPSEGIMLRGGTIHTLAGRVIEGGSVLIRDGKIVAVGKNFTPPDNYRIIDIPGQQVWPGMIDAASMLGLDSTADNQASDAAEPGLLNPQLRAADAVNPSSDHIAFSRANGVTSVIEMAEGDLLAGQMSLIHLDAATAGPTTVAPLVAIHLRFPALTIHPIPPHEDDDADDDPAPPPPVPYEQAKAEYDRNMLALNSFFDEARAYWRAKRAHAPGVKADLRLEAMLPVFDGTTPLFVTAVREREIREAVAFAEKQKVRIILADAYESYKCIPLLKEHKIPVVLGPTFTLPLNPDDPYDRSFTTAGELYRAGIPFAIATFSARRTHNLPYQAAAAVPFGLPQEEAYRAVSLSAAEIFGLSKTLGSLEEGKTADLIVTDGDPLEATTKVKMVFIDGRPVSLDTRPKQLFEKYSARPR